MEMLVTRYVPIKDAYEKVDSVVIELDYDINQEKTKMSQEYYLSFPLSSYVEGEEFDCLWKAILRSI